jgi:hypothetical protein
LEVFTSTGKAIAGGCAWVIAAALQVIPAQWPDLLRPHPWGMGLALGIGGLMFFFAAIDTKTGGKANSSVNSVGRDNSGQMIHAPNSTIHISRPPILEPVALPIPMPPDPSVNKSAFNILSPTMVTAEWDGHKWEKGPSKNNISIVTVENKIFRESGSRIDAIKDVSASIRFTRDDGLEVGYVERAYWLDYQENAININGAQAPSVVLGKWDAARWIFYNNKRSIPLSYAQIMRQGDDSEIRYGEFVLVGTITAEVIFFSRGYTLGSATIQISKLANDFLNVVMLK